MNSSLAQRAGLAKLRPLSENKNTAQYNDVSKLPDGWFFNENREKGFWDDLEKYDIKLLDQDRSDYQKKSENQTKLQDASIMLKNLINKFDDIDEEVFADLLNISEETGVVDPREKSLLFDMMKSSIIGFFDNMKDMGESQIQLLDSLRFWLIQADESLSETENVLCDSDIPDVAHVFDKLSKLLRDYCSKTENIASLHNDISDFWLKKAASYKHTIIQRDAEIKQLRQVIEEDRVEFKKEKTSSDHAELDRKTRQEMENHVRTNKELESKILSLQRALNEANNQNLNATAKLASNITLTDSDKDNIFSQYRAEAENRINVLTEELSISDKERAKYKKEAFDSFTENEVLRNKLSALERENEALNQKYQKTLELASLNEDGDIIKDKNTEHSTFEDKYYETKMKHQEEIMKINKNYQEQMKKQYDDLTRNFEEEKSKILNAIDLQDMDQLLKVLAQENKDRVSQLESSYAVKEETINNQFNSKIALLTKQYESRIESIHEQHNEEVKSIQKTQDIRIKKKESEIEVMYSQKVVEMEKQKDEYVVRCQKQVDDMTLQLEETKELLEKYRRYTKDMKDLPEYLVNGQRTELGPSESLDLRDESRMDNAEVRQQEHALYATKLVLNAQSFNEHLEWVVTNQRKIHEIRMEKVKEDLQRLHRKKLLTLQQKCLDLKDDGFVSPIMQLITETFTDLNQEFETPVSSCEIEEKISFMEAVEKTNELVNQISTLNNKLEDYKDIEKKFILKKESNEKLKKRLALLESLQTEDKIEIMRKLADSEERIAEMSKINKELREMMKATDLTTDIFCIYQREPYTNDTQFHTKGDNQGANRDISLMNGSSFPEVNSSSSITRLSANAVISTIKLKSKLPLHDKSTTSETENTNSKLFTSDMELSRNSNITNATNDRNVSINAKNDMMRSNIRPDAFREVSMNEILVISKQFIFAEAPNFENIPERILEKEIIKEVSVTRHVDANGDVKESRDCFTQTDIVVLKVSPQESFQFAEVPESQIVKIRRNKGVASQKSSLLNAHSEVSNKNNDTDKGRNSINGEYNEHDLAGSASDSLYEIQLTYYPNSVIYSQQPAILHCQNSINELTASEAIHKLKNNMILLQTKTTSLQNIESRCSDKLEKEFEEYISFIKELQTESLQLISSIDLSAKIIQLSPNYDDEEERFQKQHRKKSGSVSLSSIIASIPKINTKEPSLTLTNESDETELLSGRQDSAKRLNSPRDVDSDTTIDPTHVTESTSVPGKSNTEPLKPKSTTIYGVEFNFHETSEEPIDAMSQLLGACLRSLNNFKNEEDELVKRFMSETMVFEAFLANQTETDQIQNQFIEKMKSIVEEMDVHQTNIYKFYNVQERLMKHITRVKGRTSQLKDRIKDLEAEKQAELLRVQKEIVGNIDVEKDEKTPESVHSVMVIEKLKDSLDVVKRLGMIDDDINPQYNKLYSELSNFPEGKDTEQIVLEVQKFISQLHVKKPVESDSNIEMFKYDIKRLRKLRDNFKKKYEQEVDKVLNLETRIKVLNNRVNEEKENSVSNEAMLKAQIESLKQSLINSDKSDQISSLQSLLDTTQIDRDSWKQKCIKFEDSLDKSNATIAQLQREIEQLLKEADAKPSNSSHRNLLYNQELERLRSEHENDKSTAELLKKQLEETSAQNKSLIHKNIELESKYVKVVNDLNDAQDEIDDLKLRVVVGAIETHSNTRNHKPVQCNIREKENEDKLNKRVIELARKITMRELSKRRKFSEVQYSEQESGHVSPREEQRLQETSVLCKEENILIEKDEIIEKPSSIVPCLDTPTFSDVIRSDSNLSLNRQSVLNNSSVSLSSGEEKDMDEFDENFKQYNNEICEPLLEFSEDVPLAVHQPLQIQKKKNSHLNVILQPNKRRQMARTSYQHTRHQKPTNVIPLENQVDPALSINGAVQGKRSLSGTNEPIKNTVKSSYGSIIPSRFCSVENTDNIPKIQSSVIFPKANPAQSDATHDKQKSNLNRSSQSFEQKKKEIDGLDVPPPVRITLVVNNGVRASTPNQIPEAVRSKFKQPKALPPQTVSDTNSQSALKVVAKPLKPLLENSALQEALRRIEKLKDQKIQLQKRLEERDVEIVELKKRNSELKQQLHRYRLESIRNGDNYQRVTIRYDNVKRRLEILMQEVTVKEDELNEARREIRRLRASLMPAMRMKAMAENAKDFEDILSKQKIHKDRIAASTKNAIGKSQNVEVRKHLETLLSNTEKSIARIERQRKVWKEEQQKQIMGALDALSYLDNSPFKTIKNVFPPYSPFRKTRVQTMYKKIRRDDSYDKLLKMDDRKDLKENLITTLQHITVDITPRCISSVSSFAGID